MSAARIKANRANSARSTGPRSAEGKRRSAGNSLRHGLTSAATVLPGESREEYEQTRAAIIESWSPASDHEQILAAVVADMFWRRQRLYRLESAFMSARMNELASSLQPGSAPDEALVRMFTDPEEMSRARLLLRYVAAAERAYKNAVTELEKLQARRRSEEAPEAGSVDAVTLASDGSEISDEFFINSMLSRLESMPSVPDGFVSQPVVVPEPDRRKKR